MHSPCVDMGYPIDFRFSCELLGYAIRPRGTRTRGTQVRGANLDRPEMVSLVPPGLRKAIQFETRSVSFLIV